MLFPPGAKKHTDTVISFLFSLGLGVQTVRQPDILLLSSIHKSYAADYVGNYVHNERLEFLGDGILGAVINKLLYLHFSQESESKLTLYKVRLVREETLALVAKDIRLGNIILLGKGEEGQGGREKDSVLSDALESFIGYLYLDQSMEIVETFIKLYIYPYLARFQHENGVDTSFKSAKSRLQEYVQQHYHVLPVYHTVANPDGSKESSYVSEVSFEGKVWATGEGKNKKAAEQSAATNFLKELHT